MTNPKPCPSCGGTAFLEQGKSSYFVCCQNSECVLAGPSRPTSDEALEAWDDLPRSGWLPIDEYPEDHLVDLLVEGPPDVAGNDVYRVPDCCKMNLSDGGFGWVTFTGAMDVELLPAVEGRILGWRFGPDTDLTNDSTPKGNRDD